MKRKNPLSGKVYFDRDGNLFMEKGIRCGTELKPKLNAREWFFLMFEACKEREFPLNKVEKFMNSLLGSPVTQWRIKKSLSKKGYL